MKNFSEILLKIFAVGVLLCLFAGGTSLFGYIVALIIGGETATTICLWIFKTYFPWVIRLTSIFTAIGLLGMYFGKIKALIVKNK